MLKRKSFCLYGDEDEITVKYEKFEMEASKI